MSEEVIPPTPETAAEATTEEQAPVTTDAAPEAAAEQPQQEAPAPFDWRKALDDAPAEELRKHPKFAGVVGSERQRWQQDWESRRAAEMEAAAKAKADEELRALAQQNPVAFADKWLSSEEAKQQQERLNELEAKARQDLGTQIGAAMHAIPEWNDVANDPEALATLAKALEGKANNEVITAWNTAALELVANRRAEKLANERLEKRLKEERQAWETEAAAQGFRFSDRPDLVRGGKAASSDPEPTFGSPEWRAWYERTTPGATRLAGRR